MNKKKNTILFILFLLMAMATLLIYLTGGRKSVKELPILEVEEVEEDAPESLVMPVMASTFEGLEKSKQLRALGEETEEKRIANTVVAEPVAIATEVALTEEKAAPKKEETIADCPLLTDSIPQKFVPLEMEGGTTQDKGELTAHRVHAPVLFVPKGQWFFGGSVAYTDHTNSNYKMLVVENWEGAGYTLTGRIYFGYAVKDNMGVGIKGGFERSQLHIDNANLNLGDDLSFGVNHVRYINQQWNGTVFIRNFISLFKSRQFGLFNDTELTFGGGRSKMISGTGETLQGTYESVFKASIGISPGIIVFMHNIAAIEVSVGVLGFQTTSRKQITNQVYQGSRRNTGAQFGVDLLSIKLGGTIYLNSRRFKQRSH